jgi:hypothetical protein
MASAGQQGRSGVDHLSMSNNISVLGAIDRWCGQIAAAMHGAEWQIYATLAVMVVLSVMLFPPKNDRDQI